MSWELPLLTTLILSALSFWWIRPSSSASTLLKAIGAILCALAFYPDPTNLLKHLYSTGFQSWHQIRLDVLLATHFRMVLTLGAVVWLLHRSWQTLWKPVPELINILGVDVPEPPDVSLAGIRPDAATLSWTRPPNNRPVQRYLIQVNGINVGESPGNEIAITVTGLKPNHFYNIRVVAIGPNNFQAASGTVRLRTFGKDGKPYLGNARLPANFVDDDDPRIRASEESTGSEGHSSSFAAAVEAAPVLDGNANAAREAAPIAPAQRRNTIGRRHSPSVASSDQVSIKQPETDGPEPSLDELNHKFQEIRREINDTLTLLANDEEESQQNEEELRKERDRKKMCLKEKEEQTAQLKSLIRATMEQMRGAEKDRGKKDQQLKDRETKKSKVRDNISKLEKEVERMKNEYSGFQAQKAALEEKRDGDIYDLDRENNKLQEEHNQLEADLSNKGKQLNEMKETRKHLPGADDEQLKENDELSRREWEAIRNTLHHQLVEETKASHQLDQHYHALLEQLSIHHQAAFFNQAEAPADLDNQMSVEQKRDSYNSSEHRLSPPIQFSMSESTASLPPGLGRLGFGPALFIPENANEPQTEDELRTTAGPLSPSAHAYLPSGIIDFEGSDPRPQQTPQLTGNFATGDQAPQSPTSSTQSMSLFSSPHGSSNNLPFPQYQDSDRGSLNMKSSPAASPAGGLRLASLLAGFHRNRGAKEDIEEGLPIGSLKPGQSQSFPRGTDEAEFSGGRRRMSFSLKGHRNSTGLDNPTHVSTGSKMLSRRLNPFASSASAIFPDRDPQSSRPPSIASSDMPRPSTDSGSIWGTPGDGGGLAKNRLWAPSAPSEGRWPSRSGSRRPSIHGSPSALTTSLASADDEILYETELMDPQTSPSQVGVIGSRPPGLSKSISQRLNPNAPTFKGLFRKDKDKDRSKDKAKDIKGKGKDKEVPSLSVDSPTGPDDSPEESRLSRDTFSLHTQTSVSESHESLPLEGSSSNADPNNSLPRDGESVNSIRKLLRKGSSSKFSLSGRLGKDSSLFKKGPGSATNSDRNTSADHRSSIGDLDELGEDHLQLGRSYESVASSPSLPPTKSKDAKESRMSNWRFMKKKGKESLDLERSHDEE